MSNDGDDVAGDGIRELLAGTVDNEVEPQRSSVRGAMKSLRLRKHGVEHLNESFEGVRKLLHGLATLWSVERERDV